MADDIEIKTLTIDLASEISRVNKETAEELAVKVQEKAPTRTGKYAKGWTSIQDDDGSAIVYNKGKHKSLSHLLEKGHMDKAGKFVPAKPHIEPATNEMRKVHLDKMSKIKIEAK